MTRDAHQARHQELHRALDELLADFITHHPGPWLQRSIEDLMRWSFQQTQDPVPCPGTTHDEGNES